MSAQQPDEKTRVVRVVERHGFLTTDGQERGFCAGPHCSGVTTRREHAEHVADMLASAQPFTPGASS